MSALRTLLIWVAMLLIWSAPFFAKKRGDKFWQTGLLWKYSIYFLTFFILQIVLIYSFGFLIGLLGDDPGYTALYVALTVFAVSEIGIISWLIFRRR